LGAATGPVHLHLLIAEVACHLDQRLLAGEPLALPDELFLAADVRPTSSVLTCFDTM
jgi:hypothetical protein